jgi:hypothetical protein
MHVPVIVCVVLVPDVTDVAFKVAPAPTVNASLVTAPAVTEELVPIDTAPLLDNAAPLVVTDEDEPIVKDVQEIPLVLIVALLPNNRAAQDIVLVIVKLHVVPSPKVIEELVPEVKLLSVPPLPKKV